MLSVYLKFDTERDLLDVQSAVSDLIKNYYYVTKADLMELIGEQSCYEDTKIGWDRNGIIIPPDDNTTRWILEFPNPSRIISITIFERNHYDQHVQRQGQPRIESDVEPDQVLAVDPAMRLCKYCLMAHMDAPTGTYTVRRLTFSDGFHWCEYCSEGANREPARYLIMTLKRIDAEKSS